MMLSDSEMVQAREQALAVLILVIVDDALWPDGEARTTTDGEVLILVIVDDALWRIIK